MTNEEIAVCIREGERGLLPGLWAGVERFVWRQARRQATISGGAYYGLTAEDLYQTGYITLVDAAERFDPERGSFIGCLALYLRNAWAEAAGVRSERQQQDPILFCESLDAPYGDEPDGETLGDRVPDERDELGDAERRIWAGELHGALDRAMCEALTPLQQDIVRRRYFDEEAPRTIAAATGEGLQRVQSAERTALGRLRAVKYRRELEAYIDAETDYYRHVGASTFARTGTSAVERAVLWRDRQRE